MPSTLLDMRIAFINDADYCFYLHQRDLAPLPYDDSADRAVCRSFLIGVIIMSSSIHDVDDVLLVFRPPRQDINEWKHLFG